MSGCDRTRSFVGELDGFSFLQCLGLALLLILTAFWIVCLLNSDHYGWDGKKCWFSLHFPGSSGCQKILPCLLIICSSFFENLSCLIGVFIGGVTQSLSIQCFKFFMWFIYLVLHQMNRQQRFSPILSFSPTQLFPLLCTSFLILYNLICGFLVLLLRLLESFLTGPYLSYFLTCFSIACGLLVSSLSRILTQDYIDF